MSARAPQTPNGTRERLARISHHFLTEPEPPPRPAPSLLPVVLDDDSQDLLVYGLAQTCHARGTITRVLHTEAQLRAADSRSSPLYELIAPAALMDQLDEELSGTKPPPDLCLIPLLTAESPMLANYSHTVLLVPATPAATVRAYLRIKCLRRANPDAQPGIVMLSNDADVDPAALYDRISAASRRFLDCEPVWLGRLAGSERSRTPHGMLELAETLGRRGFAIAPDEPGTAASESRRRAAAVR